MIQNTNKDLSIRLQDIEESQDPSLDSRQQLPIDATFQCDLYKTATFFDPKSSSQTTSRAGQHSKNDFQSSFNKYTSVHYIQGGIQNNKNGSPKNNISYRERDKSPETIASENYTLLSQGSPQPKERFQLGIVTSPSSKQHSFQFHKRSQLALKMSPSLQKNEENNGVETQQKYTNVNDSEFWNKVNNIIADSDCRQHHCELFNKKCEKNPQIERNEIKQPRQLSLPLIHKKNEIEKKEQVQKTPTGIPSIYLDSTCSTRDSLRQSNYQFTRQTFSQKPPTSRDNHMSLLSPSRMNMNLNSQLEILNQGSPVQKKNILQGYYGNNLKLLGEEQQFDDQSKSCIFSPQRSHLGQNSSHCYFPPKLGQSFIENVYQYSYQNIQSQPNLQTCNNSTRNLSPNPQNQELPIKNSPSSSSSIIQHLVKSKSKKNPPIQRFPFLKHPNQLIQQEEESKQDGQQINNNAKAPQEILSLKEAIQYHQQSQQQQQKINQDIKNKAITLNKFSQLISSISSPSTSEKPDSTNSLDSREKISNKELGNTQNKVKIISKKSDQVNSKQNLNNSGELKNESYQFLRCNEQLQCEESTIIKTQFNNLQGSKSSTYLQPLSDPKVENDKTQISNHDFSFCEESQTNPLKICQSAQGYRLQVKRINLRSKQQENLVKKLFKIEELPQKQNSFIPNPHFKNISPFYKSSNQNNSIKNLQMVLSDSNLS